VLAKRHGVRRHRAYGWNIIEIKTAPPVVAGLIWPLSAQAFEQFSPRAPATEFTGVTWFGSDARENLRLTLEQLSPRLGEAAVSDSSNTVGRRWKFGPAELALTVWPPDLRRHPMTNPAHRREPRLEIGCHIAITTGLRLPASDQEREWLANFNAIAAIGTGSGVTVETLRATPALQSELEFVREPIDGVDRLLGQVVVSADGRALIFCRDQLYVAPMAKVVGFRVVRTRPARGPGGSRLEVECRTDYRGGRTKRLLIAAAAGPDDLNDLAAEISKAAGKPYELAPYVDDD
jgi:hypothetical protein